MSQVRELQNATCGEVIFMPAVGFTVIKDFALSLKSGSDGANYKSLYIRKKEDRYVLGFAHESEPNSKEERAFYHKITDILQRHFGPDLRGWSLSSPVWVIE